MSVGLISLIIFNIVLANNTSDSESTTGCSSLLEEKTKKTHKTTEKSVNVKGKRPYEKDYEENCGDMKKDIFMPLEGSYQYRRNDSHKQDDVPSPIYKGPKKQTFAEKRQLRTINENKEICQKPKDLLCTDPEKDTKTKSTTESKTESTTESKVRYSTSEEIYEKNKHLLCTNPEETKHAEKLMDEAVAYLERYATSRNGYEPIGSNCNSGISYYKKTNQSNANILKANYLYFGNPNKYDAIIDMLWDPDSEHLFNNGFIKIARVYDPNLVIIQQRYKKGFMSDHKYFYALAKKAQIEDAAIIVMTSANINDQYPSDKEYKNTIIENANLFTTDIDSEDDIRKGKLKKVFVNIAGYLIEKKNNHVHITYIESIDGHASF
ncbi:fam-a protein [Plasmodium vinckei]|uniref:Fam-a protein n=1 Tax=Plasmodium vinckei TaxID=5860 RepID=A0A6V7SK70_PLAVN|nr:fam-a protein [Plasmodium vinckei]